jgi:CHASE1-domain containing sensor protein
MTQALTWLVVLLAIALMIWALVSENDRRHSRTVAEWNASMRRARVR